jgi:hypothetical protein
MALQELEDHRYALRLQEESFRSLVSLSDEYFKTRVVRGPTGREAERLRRLYGAYMDRIQHI